VLVLKGKRGKSSLSPASILSGLSNAGSPFGLGREEDAHEFMKYVNAVQFTACAVNK
jgi:ubiquitin carboxyl-terminal hydrolase 36/42